MQTKTLFTGMILTVFTLGGVSIAITGDVIDDFLYYGTACPGYANAVWADVDGIDGGHPTYGRYETMVVFTTLTGRAYVDDSGYPTFNKTYYFTPIAGVCGGSPPWDRVRLKIHFVDMLAPGFNQMNPATWEYRSVDAVSIEASAEGGPCTENGPWNISVLAYRELGQTGIIESTPGSCGGYYFTDTAGVKELFITSDYCENELDNLILDGNLAGEEILIDNGDPGTSSVGPWEVSSAPNPWGGDSMENDHQDGGPFPPIPTYSFEASVSRRFAYEVYMWWTQSAGRCDDVIVDIFDDDTLLDTYHINQQANGGQWNLLGTYEFDCGKAEVRIVSSCLSDGLSTCADAVKFVNVELLDSDDDTVPDIFDNCPFTANTDQADGDGDGVGNVCDNCPDDFNEYQTDLDDDGLGDTCDNCFGVSNPGQENSDSDSHGDVCDNCPDDTNEDQADGDSDGAGNVCDNCPDDYNPGQQDLDGDGAGDICDLDDDGDGIPDDVDNCPTTYNPGQQDKDGDGMGDACDLCPDDAQNDEDGDGICAGVGFQSPQTGDEDNCPQDANPGQEDLDTDGHGDVCDNCPDHHNPDQKDSNSDGIGDVCARDLRPGMFIVTQAIQNINNDIPLVRGKPAWVRVFVILEGVPDNVTVPGVTGKLVGYRPDGSTSEVLPHPRFITVKKNPDRGELTDTLNFRLPDEWLLQDNRMIFWVEVNPDRSVYEIDYTNNTSFPLGTTTFQKRGSLNLMFVPVRVNNCHPSRTDFDLALEFVRKTYPISEIYVEQDDVLEFNIDPTVRGFYPISNGELLVAEIWLRNLFTADELDRNMHFYGLVCDCAAINCQGTTSGTAGSTGINNEEAWGLRGGGGTMPNDPTNGGSSMAHELGHNFNRMHAPSRGDPICATPDPDSVGPNYDDIAYAPHLGDYGFDGSKVYKPNDYYDFMSYCDPPWVSEFVYRKLSHKFPTSWKSQVVEPLPTSKNTEQEYLVVTGFVLLDGTVITKPFRKIMLPVGTDDEPGTGPYSLELQNNSEALLFARYYELNDLDNNAFEFQALREKFPYHPNTAKIQLKHGDIVLKTIIVSANEPVVTVTYPNGGESLSGMQTITWTATDADGDPLTYDVLYSRDGGNTWSAVAMGLDENSYAWDTDKTAGSNQALIRVMATDGVNTGQDDSDSFFTVPKKAPEPVILAPQDNAGFFLEEMIILKGTAYDWEDGTLDPNSIIWWSDRDGQIGPGHIVAVNNLSPGDHLITLEAEDSDGNLEAADIIIIQVYSVSDSDGDEIGDDVDNCPLTYNPDQADGDSDGIGDVCDEDDTDGDGFPDNVDNCGLIPNDQDDYDDDGLGDQCDNCPFVANSDQADLDGNGYGDVCEIIYVDANATGPLHNGSCWEYAYKYLQDALTEAETGFDVIWVAQGTYKPDEGNGIPLGDPITSFQLLSGVEIYGGYAGFGAPNPNSRNINEYKTILSGDIGTPIVDTDNSYHVVTSSGTDATAVLDGFTITAGNANGSNPYDRGGGMYNMGSSPTVTNCTFSGNSAGSWGGGMFNYLSRPIVSNCTFSGNSAGSWGGGMFNYFSSSPIVANCTFSGNSADSSGGGMCSARSSPTVTNCTFSGNSANDNGGGMCNIDSSPTVTNCILWGDSAPSGPEIFNINSAPVVTYSDIAGGYGGTGNINSDPLFVDANGPDDIAGTEDDNVRLSAGSPCIDAGDNPAVPADTADLDDDGNVTEPIPWDLDKHLRFVDGDCNDTDIVDMGSYEFDFAYLGDCDSDCDVDLFDYSLIAAVWMTTEGDPGWNTICDLNEDGSNNMLDLAVLIQNWLAGT